MIYVINFILAVVMAYFSLEIYIENQEPNASVIFVAFSGWYLLAWLLSYFYDRNGHFKKLPRIFGLVIFYLRQLFSASILVAYDVLTPRKHIKPGILAFPLQAETDLEITLLANLITLTPGSLSIDVSKDRKILYVHEIYIKNNDLDRVKEKIRSGFENRILRITR